MVYLVGIIGFIIGFLAGQYILLRLLRNRTNKELRDDKNLRWYGLLNWMVAGLFSYGFIALYEFYFF